MARALNNDLRFRMLKAASDGTSARRAAARLSASISTAICWIATAELAWRTARPQAWQSAFRLDAHGIFIVGMIETQNDIALDAMLNRLDAEAGVRIGCSALNVWLRREGRTFKKKYRARIGARVARSFEAAPGLVRQPA